MNDIIKEFNMISLLGILLPGALLMALFGTEFEVWSRTCDYFGVTMSTGLVSTILIIAGFAFGSLLHELGDLVEKCLWSTRLLNPRTYAAIRSGYAAFYGRKYAEQLKAAAEKETEDEPFTLRTALALALLLGGGLAALLGGAWFLAGGLAFLVLLDRKGRLYRSLVCTRMVQNVDRTVHCLRAIVRSILLGVYGAYTGGVIHEIRADIFSGTAKVVISILVMGLLLLRYYHYSYLKYKYSYEDLLAQEREPGREKTASA